MIPFSTSLSIEIFPRRGPRGKACWGLTKGNHASRFSMLAADKTPSQISSPSCLFVSEKNRLIYKVNGNFYPSVMVSFLCLRQIILLLTIRCRKRIAKWRAETVFLVDLITGAVDVLTRESLLYASLSPGFRVRLTIVPSKSYMHDSLRGESNWLRKLANQLKSLAMSHWLFLTSDLFYLQVTLFSIYTSLIT